MEKMTIEKVKEYLKSLNLTYKLKGQSENTNVDFDTLDNNIFRGICNSYTAGKLFKKPIYFENSSSWTIERFTKLKQDAQVPENAELYLEFARYDNADSSDDTTEFRWYREYANLEDFFKCDDNKFMIPNLVAGIKHEHQTALKYLNNKK